MTEQALDNHVNQLSEDEEIKQSIKSQLRNLAYIRLQLERRKDDLDNAQAKLDATPEYAEVQELLAGINALKQQEENLKAYISADGLRLSELSNYEDRKPISGVQVKEFSTVEILDENKAKKWAGENAPDVLSISASKFNKVAKVLTLDFVKLGTEYKAQVASDLSEYLDDELPF